MSHAASSERRRPFQFRLWHLFWCMTVIAVYLGVGRLGLGIGAMITFVVAELTVVVVGTAIFVSRGTNRRLSRLALRGILAGGCLAGLCFGWIPAMIAIFAFDPRPLLALAAVIGIGALVGLVIGLVVPLFLPRPVPDMPHPIGAFVMFQPFDRSQHRALARATDRALRLLSVTQRSAAEHRHEFITPEHLLLALATDTGVARATLERLGIDLTKETKRLALLVAAIPPDAGEGKPTLSSELERVLDFAFAQSETIEYLYFGVETKDVYVGAEHLVLGLLANRDCKATQYLENQGVTLERYRTELLKLMGCH